MRRPWGLSTWRYPFEVLPVQAESFLPPGDDFSDMYFYGMGPWGILMELVKPVACAKSFKTLQCLWEKNMCFFEPVGKGPNDFKPNQSQSHTNLLAKEGSSFFLMSTLRCCEILHWAWLWLVELRRHPGTLWSRGVSLQRGKAVLFFWRVSLVQQRRWWTIDSIDNFDNLWSCQTILILYSYRERVFLSLASCSIFILSFGGFFRHVWLSCPQLYSSCPSILEEPKIKRRGTKINQKNIKNQETIFIRYRQTLANRPNSYKQTQYPPIKLWRKPLLWRKTWPLWCNVQVSRHVATIGRPPFFSKSGAEWERSLAFNCLVVKDDARCQYRAEQFTKTFCRASQAHCLTLLTPFVFWLCFFWPWTDESIVQRVEVVGAQFSEAEPVRDGQFVRFKVFRWPASWTMKIHAVY